MLKHLDLCSGIGGFALGFEWAGLSRPVMFCDFEPWCRQILNKHWPDVPIANDVKEIANVPEKIPELGRNSILTAGYPCQPFSYAGKRKGEEDDRHIWPYIRQIVASKRPTWCVFENVYGHVSMGLDTVLSDLEADGYATRPFIVPACGVDAPHRRDRVWIIAHAISRHLTDAAGRKCGNTENIGRDWRCEAVGRERQAHQQEQQSSFWGELSRSSEDVADTDSAQQQRGRFPSGIHKEHADFDSGSNKIRRQDAQFWKPEPRICRVANGIPRRVDRLKGLGNAIVPQIAMQIGLTIKAVHEGAER